VFEKRRIRKHGRAANATVVHAQQHPKITTNDFRKYDFVVDVRPDDEAAFRTEIQETFTVGGLKPGEGDVVKVLYDPASKQALFDLDGDPRYDLKAMRASQEEERRRLLREPPGSA
jgi:hypothetical protein